MRIDSHQHFWQYHPVRDAWITDDMNVIQRDFSPADLLPQLIQSKIDGCVAVQADQSEAESMFLINHAEKNDFVKGVVGWVDLRAENINERLDYFNSFKRLKGFRHIVQGEVDNRFLLGADFCKGIRALRDKGFTYDILIYPKQLETTVEFVQKFPNQPFVIDHIAKPFIKEGRLDNWERYIRVLGALENVYCKVSGMVTEADWKLWKYKDFLPYLDVVFDSFGSKRIMYGSDWPVCLVAASYQQQLDLIERYISRLSVTEQADIMGGNAIRFYNL